jgi:hypothetical protein
MNKLVKCPACGEGYNLDLDKYGGKKIRCKKCPGIISVPTAAQAQDEFEVVEEGVAQVPPAAPAPVVPASAPPSVLQRHRMASQRGAVNIALLQRSEASREDIRNGFLAVHGSCEARSAPIAELQRQLQESQSAMSQPQEKLAWLKDVLSRALASDPGKVGDTLTGSAEGKVLGFFKKAKSPLYKNGDEDAYAYAVSITGRPVRELPSDEEFKAQAKKRYKEDDRSLDKDGMWTEYDFEKEIRATCERAIKIDTIKAAIQAFDAKNQALEAAESVRRQKLQQQMAAFMQSHKTRFDQALAQMADGRLPDATMTLQEMLKSAPVAMLGQVLVALSKCTYLSGNASNAARHIQDAMCFGASAPVDMDEGYNDLWAKASAGLPKV